MPASSSALLMAQVARFRVDSSDPRRYGLRRRKSHTCRAGISALSRRCHSKVPCRSLPVSFATKMSGIGMGDSHALHDFCWVLEWGSKRHNLTEISMVQPKSNKYVIIGSGVHGLSTAYHLAVALKAEGRARAKTSLSIKHRLPPGRPASRAELCAIIISSRRCGS